MIDEEAAMLAPWMIEKLREEEEAQNRRDRESWGRQPRLETDLPFRYPPVATPVAGDGRTEGGIETLDFTVL